MTSNPKAADPAAFVVGDTVRVKHGAYEGMISKVFDITHGMVELRHLNKQTGVLNQPLFYFAEVEKHDADR